MARTLARSSGLVAAFLLAGAAFPFVAPGRLSQPEAPRTSQPDGPKPKAQVSEDAGRPYAAAAAAALAMMLLGSGPTRASLMSTDFTSTPMPEANDSGFEFPVVQVENENKILKNAGMAFLAAGGSRLVGEALVRAEVKIEESAKEKPLR
mmetsp:Transcript_73127/g.174388  ORF Transcript_73127/g.174388 Transcript_73127/m.174388 type:complete len:150 (+) Transcript_73127:66-515(+)|eukprot:CAMPEP_0181486542 /NCGR_PEP_ID=MMETSP1110-20121109/47235_1 /TAXON_ID=174948 /ORGANISM="Symbiodinium sp., Strain CCMP421" /LENGTH=149 /DNA_ID=CAMNT_0023612777 /DNA_START=65 /DNA_END=514 /DNA_ORIENTATION=-